MRDVQDEDGRRQNGRDPDQPRICGVIHEDSCTCWQRFGWHRFLIVNPRVIVDARVYLPKWPTW
jgi:hypothetical protein